MKNILPLIVFFLAYIFSTPHPVNSHTVISSTLIREDTDINNIAFIKYSHKNTTPYNETVYIYYIYNNKNIIYIYYTYQIENIIKIKINDTYKYIINNSFILPINIYYNKKILLLIYESSFRTKINIFIFSKLSNISLSIDNITFVYYINSLSIINNNIFLDLYGLDNSFRKIYRYKILLYSTNNSYKILYTNYTGIDISMSINNTNYEISTLYGSFIQDMGDEDRVFGRIVFGVNGLVYRLAPDGVYVLGSYPLRRLGEGVWGLYYSIYYPRGDVVYYVAYFFSSSGRSMINVLGYSGVGGVVYNRSVFFNHTLRSFLFAPSGFRNILVADSHVIDMDDGRVVGELGGYVIPGYAFMWCRSVYITPWLFIIPNAYNDSGLGFLVYNARSNSFVFIPVASRGQVSFPQITAYTVHRNGDTVRLEYYFTNETGGFRGTIMLTLLSIPVPGVMPEPPHIGLLLFSSIILIWILRGIRYEVSN